MKLIIEGWRDWLSQDKEEEEPKPPPEPSIRYGNLWVNRYGGTTGHGRIYTFEISTTFSPGNRHITLRGVLDDNTGYMLSGMRKGSGKSYPRSVPKSGGIIVDLEKEIKIPNVKASNEKATASGLPAQFGHRGSLAIGVEVPTPAPRKGDNPRDFDQEYQHWWLRGALSPESYDEFKAAYEQAKDIIINGAGRLSMANPAPGEGEISLSSDYDQGRLSIMKEHKLIVENWRSTVEKWKEEGNEDKYGLSDRYQGTNIQVGSVQLLMSPLAYPDQDRLMTVASWKSATGRTETFAFYSTTGDTTSGMSFSAGWWLPFMGIDKNGWIIKLRTKYPHPNSILGQVGQEIGKKYPPEAIKDEYRKQNQRYRISRKSIRARNRQAGSSISSFAITEEIKNRFIEKMNKYLQNYDALNYKINDCLKKCSSLEKGSAERRACNTECYDMFGHSEWKTGGISWS